MVANAGLPLSVTTTLNVLVVIPDGVQVKTPVLALIEDPLGGLPLRLYVNVSPGRSSSVPTAVNVTAPVPTSAITSAKPSRCGGVFTFLTTTWRYFVSLEFGEPSSVTTWGMWSVIGLCTGCGCQVKTPVMSSMKALVGAPAPRLKVRLFAGTSASVAVLVTTIMSSVLIDRLVEMLLVTTSSR